MRVALGRRAMFAALLALAFSMVLGAHALAYEVAGWSVETLQAEMPFWISPESSVFDEHMPVGQSDAGRVVFVSQGSAEFEQYVVVYDADTGQTRRIGPGDLAPTDPQIRGDHVIWVGHDGPDPEIFLHTLSTGVTRKLTDDLADEGSPSLSDRYVVWLQDGSMDTSLIAYDLTTGVTKVITDDLQSSSYTLRGSWVISPRYWSEDMGVRVYNLATGQSSEPPALDRETTWIRDMGDGFVLTQAESGGGPLYLYDLATGTAEQISEGETGGGAVDPEGTRIAWSEWEEGAGAKVCVRDLATGETQSIPVPGASVGTLAIRGQIVLWRAVPLGEKDYPVDRYYAHVLGQGTATQLLYAYGLGMPLLDGRNVYWPSLNWTQGESGDDLYGGMDLRIASPPTGSLASFIDVPGNSPERTAIVSLAERGVISGYPEGDGFAFRPEKPFLRAQFAKMIVETLKLPVDESLSTAFTDLGPDDPSDLYPHDYVAAAVADGIVKGVSPTSFAPWLDVSRAQLVTMVVRAAEKRFPDLFELYPDEPPIPVPGDFSPVHAPYMYKAERAGLVYDFAGYGPGWDPWQTATRAEGAELLWNLVELIENQR